MSTVIGDKEIQIECLVTDTVQNKVKNIKQKDSRVTPGQCKG